MSPETAAVLHLEDSDLDADLIRDRLERAGLPLALDRVSDRAAFLDRLTARRYALILSDYQVPAFEGLEALELAKEHQPGVPFIFVSGALGEEVAVETLRRGATDYILKERLARLAPAVGRAMAEARERAARRRAEEERERLLAELGRREQELRLVTDAVPALISYQDAGAVYRFANRAHEVWFGRPREQVVGRHMSEVLGEDVYRAVRPSVERVLRGERHEFETFAAYRYGGGRHIHVNYVPRLEGERVVGFYALVADVTAAKRAEEALRDADRRKDEFLATLAHELRNPLAPIRNALQVVKLSGERAVRERARGTMERQLTHMVRLIDDLLDVSRITRGKLDLHEERVDMAAVVGQAVETARPHMEAAGHGLSVSLPPDPVPLFADPVRLAQVFANLLNNAAKYTEPGGRVWLDVERHGGEAVVRVRDTGVGIPADMLPRVFDLFTQVDASRDKAQGGLGIGLTLVKRLVEMHGGVVEARSDGVGRGSEFVVRLPALAGHHAPASPTAGGPDAAPPRRSILVVDDNRDGAESLAEMLRIMGNEVRTAHDGLEAVRSAEEFRPDVLLLDVGLPKLSGHEAARRIRAEPWGRGMVIVAVTGWGQDGDRRQSLEAGCDFHMVKPVNPAELRRFLAGLSPVPA